MPYKIVNNRKYKVRIFRTVRETNQFLENNPDWGVIAEDGKSSSENSQVAIYVARLSDKGKLLKK